MLLAHHSPFATIQIKQKIKKSPTSKGGTFRLYEQLSVCCLFAICTPFALQSSFKVHLLVADPEFCGVMLRQSVCPFCVFGFSVELGRVWLAALLMNLAADFFACSPFACRSTARTNRVTKCIRAVQFRSARQTQSSL